MENNSLIRKIGADNVIFITIMLLFSIFGAVFGMSEETIAFIIIFVPMAITMGYDSITGVSLCFVAAGLGFAGAILNPFTIGIAQGLSAIPLFSGIQYRMLCWLIINIIGFIYILRYAAKIKRDPMRSPVKDDDKYWRDKTETSQVNFSSTSPTSAWTIYIIVFLVLGIFSWFYPLTNLTVGESSVSIPAIPALTILFLISGYLTLKKSVHFFIIQILLFTILILITGVMGYGWYIKEIAYCFLRWDLLQVLP
jgi:uncharacterized ion transporter superfamily protein YfcC